MSDRADFRSDTMTVPTPAMRAAMSAADVGDDVWGEDPTVAELERAGAGALGKEAAVFTPSGTMANQLAIHVHCRPGDELICESRSHVFLYEGGAVARLSGTQIRTVEAASGFLDPAAIAAAVRSDDPHYPRSRLLVLENTHNMAGGRVLDVAGMAARSEVAKAHGMQVHVDGARLANAAVALGCSMAELTAAVDSTTLCLSKGLGAPVGSLLAGTAEFVYEARRARKAFGGAMRQAGVIAAAGLLALNDGPAALVGDHERARRLATGLAELPFGSVDVATTDTNIVMFDLHEPAGGRGAVRAAAEFVAHLAEHGVLAAPTTPFRVRFVLHRDLTDADVDRALAASAKFGG
ncbi:MAG: aminotransferase class I/II-fold pyridoxal phosphate-dependent enzyme [bacterium]|nr:aminotransferase class I/II-fold pyridoxal phosphate-dependent enzyme [bacterium]